MKIAHVFLFLSFLLLISCGSNVETFESTQTLGAQLDDLHKAYNSNAITEQEYKEAKEIIIDHYQ